MRRFALIAVVCVASAAIPHEARAQDSIAGDEGPLDNDAFLPFNRDASEQLALGDDAYAKLVARKSAASADARAWTDVFEAWHGALAASRTGDIVPPRPRSKDAGAISPWPDPDGTASQTLERRGDGVEYAVLRRVAALDASVRELWTARFGPLAERELAAAPRDVLALARVEREYPATAAAVRAAVALAESEFERAQPDAARAWIARARTHLELAPAATANLRAAVERRAELFAGESHAPLDEPWTRAEKLELVNAILVDTSQRNLRGSMLVPGVGRRPGMAFVGDGFAALQLPNVGEGEGQASGQIQLVELEHARRSASPFQPGQLLPTTWSCGALDYSPPEPAGWPLLPAASGQTLVIVHGRQVHEGNALMCIEVDASVHIDPPRLPHLAWAVHDGMRCDPRGEVGELAGLEAQRLEFQPGPLIVGATVCALAREYVRTDAPFVPESRPNSANEIRTWMLAFDLATGELRWRCDLGKGTEVRRTSNRIATATLGTASAQPPERCGEFVFAGTHTGVGALVSSIDGRVAWVLKCRRREPGRTTWTGARAVSDERANCIVWAPADSDRLYWLRAAPDLDGRGVMLHPSRAVGDADVLLGGDAARALVLRDDGSQRQLCAWDAATGAVTCAPELAPGERFTGDGLCSDQRALFASDHSLYLLDRARDAYLLDAADIDRAVFAKFTLPGGSLWARGDSVCVLGLTTLWIFRAR